MTINLKLPDIRELKPRITVFGVGGAGGNAVNNMITAGLLVYPQLAHLEPNETRSTRHSMTGTGGYFARVGRWLRESF